MHSSTCRTLSTVLLVVLVAVSQVMAQQDIFFLMERTDITVREAEQIAQRYFDSVGTGRGTGYKQFQRWLYERKFHVDGNGYFISPQTEWNNFLQAYSLLAKPAALDTPWTELGPHSWTRTTGWNPGVGRLSAFAVHPANESVIYVGSPGGGIWKSVNAGATWQPLTDNNSSRMSIYALAIDPLDQNVVYAGTSNAGVIKSVNAGTTWNATGAGPSGTVRKVLINPSSTNQIFATSSGGIYRSTNAGTSWTRVHTVSTEDIEFKPDDLNIMYASGTTVYRSINNGMTWTQVGTEQGIPNIGRTLIGVTPADPNRVYVAQANDRTFGWMYKSTDSGVSFVTTVVGNPATGTNYFGYESNGQGTGGQATYDMALDVSPVNATEVHIGGIICWYSTDEGKSFTPLTEWSLPNSRGYNHADVHGLFWVNSTLYSISDGGLYKSTDHGDNWTDLSTGLGIRQFYRIAVSSTKPGVITGGAQDNGSSTLQTTGNWVDWLGADGMEGLVSPTNHLKLWGTSQNGSLYRSTNGGNSYSGLAKPSAGQWVTPLVMHPTNDSILYGGWTGVYKSINGGSSWTSISGTTITVALADLAVAQSNTNYIYASNDITLYVTTDGGATWATRSAAAPITDIAVDPVDPAKIWITCSSTTSRVFVSGNAGATFTNISGNLPALAARSVVVDDHTPRGIYVGMNVGVYYKEESASVWTAYMDNLPMVAVNELDLHRSSGKLRVATYGRGVWETQAVAAAPRANVKVLLQGPYNPATHLMDNPLRKEGVLESHFGAIPIPANAVDSITIEIRDAPTAGSSTIRQFQPAWLLRDGSILGFSDTTNAYASYPGVASGNYYVVVWHRNHLPIMSAAPLALSGMSSPAHDFTTAQSQAYGTNPMAQVAAGAFALYGGDANRSGIISAADANGVFGVLNFSGYDDNDLNLSGFVTAADANVVFGNLNISTQVGRPVLRRTFEELKPVQPARREIESDAK